MEAPATLRLFVALDLPAGEKARVQAAVEPLRPRFPLKWVRDESWHLTLVFLGDTAAARVPELTATLDRVCAAHPPVSLRLRGAGTFGGARPRVLWLGVEGALAPAQALQAELQAALQVKAEHDAWSPHLTLARAKSFRGNPALADAARELSAFAGAFTVPAVTLFETRGGRYHALHAAPLAQSRPPV